MVESSKRVKLVGDFIRKRRQALGIPQRTLGHFFNPPVTTQFISNVERGVTPLPPIHIPVLAKALSVSDSEMMALLEQEYALKLTGRLGKVGVTGTNGSDSLPSLIVAATDFEFIKGLYDAYRTADPKTREAFATICENVLRLPKIASFQK